MYSVHVLMALHAVCAVENEFNRLKPYEGVVSLALRTLLDILIQSLHSLPIDMLEAVATEVHSYGV